VLIRLGVCGWPVAHSRSPAMHNAALRALGLAGWRYQHLPLPPELFAEAVRALPRAGFRGVNVTIPHKEAALALADAASETARAIGAANTLTFSDRGIHADNTDAPGFLAAIGTAPATALVLGAGGSARAVIWALNHAGARVSVLARTPQRAAGLGAEVVDAPTEAEMLVNCTPLGLHADDDLPLAPDGFARVVDLAYAPGGTRLVNTARETGAEVVDGLEILVRQGALSFERWTGLEAPLDAMRLAAQGSD
jgi:shikimate dehydrogenase